MLQRESARCEPSHPSAHIYTSIPGMHDWHIPVHSTRDIENQVSEVTPRSLLARSFDSNVDAKQNASVSPLELVPGVLHMMNE